MDAKQESNVPKYVQSSSAYFTKDVLLKLSQRETLELFWRNPLCSLRTLCVDALASTELTYQKEEVAYWLDARLPFIPADDRDPEDGFRRTYRDRLLSWYLFSSGPETRSRAVTCAISLFSRHFNQEEDGRGLRFSFEATHGLSKIIYGAVKKHPELYWAPSVPEFLEQSLAHKNWTIAERALELICIAEDTSFLERVVELSRKAGEEKEKAEDFKTRDVSRFETAKARGVLQETVRHLLICKTDESESDIKNFKDTFTKAIGKRAKQDPPQMRISLNYAKGGGLESIEMHMDPIAAPARDLLEKCEVSISAHGIEITNAEREFSHPEGYGRYKHPQYRRGFSFYRTFSSAFFTLKVKQVRKTARMNITVNLLDQGTHQLGRWIHYLYRDGE